MNNEDILRAMEEEKHQLKEKLEEAERKVKFLEDEKMTAFLIGDAIADGIIVVDSKGFVTSINRGYTEITEIKEEEIVGRKIKDLLDNKYFSDAVSLEVLKKKQKISAMATIYRNNKKVLLVGTPFLDESNELFCYSGKSFRIGTFRICKRSLYRCG
ncbi:MAG TPA: PAS domain-containing protein [Anaerovoracaceae bacterium]|nr:PAS domain-containing protein [Anaerovoracaceae bacterium]